MLTEKLKNIQNIINSASQRYNRSSDNIQLLAVSKRQSAETIRNAFACGQSDFGENYLQEALDKQCLLSDLAINWHYIGQIQSNKTRLIAEHFSWVHSVDRLKIAQRLSQQRPKTLKPLQLCLQVNIDNETSKAGFHTDDIVKQAIEIASLPHIKLRGLMAIPAHKEHFNDQCKPFKKLKLCMDDINQHLGNKMDTLSMGMSNDLEAAIAEGASIVRIGTALFGPRD